MLKAIFNWTGAVASLALCGGFIWASSTLYHGEPWEVMIGSQPARGTGVYIAAYGTRARSFDFTLKGEGVKIERNPSARSYEVPGQQRGWTFDQRPAPHWDWCGTGQDEFKLQSEWKKAGISWRSGTWYQLDGVELVTHPDGSQSMEIKTDPATARAMFTLVLPHWLNVTLTAIWPLAMLVSLVRRRSRVGEGCCKTCGYNLTGNVSGVCPECGTACSAPAGLGLAATSSPSTGPC